MIHCFPLPTPFAVGRVNTYLVEDDPLTLVDCGPNSERSLGVLEDGLAGIGRSVADIERIVLTHQHLDHVGLASTLVERSGAEVCTIDALAPWMANYTENITADDEFSVALMERHGVPEEIYTGLRRVSGSFHMWGSGVTVTHPMADGSTLGFAGRTWEVHHRPGHSPSDTVFFDAASGELMAGDHLLKKISSNALVSRPLDGAPGPRPRPLMAYADSMRATSAMDVTIAMTGHGETIDDHRALIDHRLDGIARRADRLHELIVERPRNAHELAEALWGEDIAMTKAFLTLSEVLGHTDILVDDGRAVEVVDDAGHVTFSAA